jgi:uncharacterized protein (DUF849 family)
MLQACLNGGLAKAVHPSVPISAEELANDAIAVRMAGADELHIHPRDENGRETLAASDVGRALLAIRASVAEVPLGLARAPGSSPVGASAILLLRNGSFCPTIAQ